MRTSFSEARRADPVVAESEANLRKCVHCGFCIATCPTYVLLGDELDSPRGRIYLIKDMLENERPATRGIARHVDRCLSCLACVTTCPSGVDYRRLIDSARMHVERTYRRPLADRALRALLARLMPYPARFRAALSLARLVRPLGRVLPPRLRAMLALVPARSATVESEFAGTRPANGVTADAGTTDRAAAGRVAMLTGCVQSVIGQSINRATIGLLTRAGFDVVPIDGCCGSIVHHLGRDAQSHALARGLVEQLTAAERQGTFDAIVSNASGCGAQVKDFAHVLPGDAAAQAFAARTRDVVELLDNAGLPSPEPGAAADVAGMRVAYHSACSMQHGQRLHALPRTLLERAGFDVVDIPEAHLCCGSAGTYNILQPAIAGRLAERKLDNILATGAGIVAAGNLGCLTQLAAQSAAGNRAAPVFVHTVELLDWATGGPRPAAIGNAAAARDASTAGGP